MPYVGAVLLRACKPVLHYNQLSSTGIMMRDAAMVGERKTWEMALFLASRPLSLPKLRMDGESLLFAPGWAQSMVPMGVGGGAGMVPPFLAGGTGVDPREEEGTAKAAEPPKPVDAESVPPIWLPGLAPPRTRRPAVPFLPPPLAAMDLP